MGMNRLWIAGFALAVLAGLAIFCPRPAVARIGLDAGSGEAVWFNFTCTDEETVDVAAWHVQQDLTDSTRQTLVMQVENGYPGYKLACQFHLANTGSLPLRVFDVQVLNLHPTEINIQANESPPDAGKLLQPCLVSPLWLTPPDQISPLCRTTINLTVQVKPEAGQDAAYGYGIEVILTEG